MGLKEIQELKANAGKPKVKTPYVIPKISKKKAEKEKKEREERGDNDTELQAFFKQAMGKMTGYCAECGARTETHVYQYAIFSICHILEKRPTVCPSVATHPANWIELCPDHHTAFDKANWDEKEKWGCWQDVLKKLIILEPSVAQEERRHLPEQLFKALNKK